MTKISTSNSTNPLLEDTQVFQNRMWTIQRCGWGIMAVVIVAALLGLFGSGPLSTAIRGTSPDNLQVKYDRFVRRQAPTDLHITLGLPASPSTEVCLWVNRDYLDQIEVQHVSPTPIEVALSHTGLTYKFRVENPAQTAHISFTIQPMGFGLLVGLLRSDQGEMVQFRQVVYP